MWLHRLQVLARWRSYPALRISPRLGQGKAQGCLEGRFGRPLRGCHDSSCCLSQQCHGCSVGSYGRVSWGGGHGLARTSSASGAAVAQHGSSSAALQLYRYATLRAPQLLQSRPAAHQRIEGAWSAHCRRRAWPHADLSCVGRVDCGGKRLQALPPCLSLIADGFEQPLLSSLVPSRSNKRSAARLTPLHY